MAEAAARRSTPDGVESTGRAADDAVGERDINLSVRSEAKPEPFRTLSEALTPKQDFNEGSDDGGREDLRDPDHCRRLLAPNAFDGIAWAARAAAEAKDAAAAPRRSAAGFEYMSEVVRIVPWTSMRWVVPSEVPTAIGSGAMAVVAMAATSATPDPGHGRPSVVAVKILKKDVAVIQRGEVRCFAREVALLGQLAHPNLLKCHGCGAGPQGRPFCVLDLIEETVFEALRLGECATSPPARRAVSKVWPSDSRYRLAAELADALAYLHHRALPGYRVVHRDLKPDNMGVASRRQLKLFDLGLATLVGAGRGADERGQTEELHRLTPETGTQRYLSPESMLGLPYNAKVDVYCWAPDIADRPAMDDVHATLLRLRDSEHLFKQPTMFARRFSFGSNRSSRDRTPSPSPRTPSVHLGAGARRRADAPDHK
ncbi:protein kinase [Aureococcus anophagefferens]|nr:protein kinase [Aureococcus anophagefferens]